MDAGILTATCITQHNIRPDIDLHLLHTPPEQSVTVVNGEEIIIETKVTEFQPLHRYLGWTLPTNDINTKDN